jgi:hypothetical protein
MGCQLGLCRRILDEARIHKYTYTNYQLSALNIKYYNFGSSFDTTEFYNENIHVDAEEKTLDDTRATHCPKMSLSEAVNTYGVFQYVVQALSLDLSLEPPLTSPRERRTTCTQLEQ